jgi:hypothetical protein
MILQRNRGIGRPRGVALLVTLIFLVLFACLAASITASSDGSLVAARNSAESRQASALALTGVQMIKLGLGGLPVPGTHYAGDMHQAIAGRLTTVFTGSGMVNPNGITQGLYTGVTLPTITINRPDGRSGTLDVNIRASGGALDNTTVTVSAVGRFGTAKRSATYNMTVLRGKTVLSEYGIASKSFIQMTGNISVIGAHDPPGAYDPSWHYESDILSATYTATNAIQMTGNARVTGVVSVCDFDGVIKKTGNIYVGDQATNVSEPDWPTVDITDFTPYATNVMSCSCISNATVENIRIPPNTNPTFSGNTIIRGVVYVQSPNKVSFTGNTTITGVIVCDTPTVPNLSTNEVKFTGNIQTYGVESLPTGAQFDGLRGKTGSFLLASGFSARFTGNSSIVNGCLVASQFQFTGNAGGRIKGGIVCLADSSFTVTGNAPLIIDKDNMPDNPAGLSSSYKLICVSGSYAE